MAGNLDDFLKRAAQRRAQSEAAKRGQQHQQAVPPRRRPEYTDQRRERQVVMADDDDDVVVAEVVPGIRGEAKPYRQFPASSSGDSSGVGSTSGSSQLQSSSNHPVSTFEARARDAAVVSVAGQAATEPQSGQRVSGLPEAAIVERPAAHPLVAVFKNPQSIAQAILMREILDRPIDRW